MDNTRTIFNRIKDFNSLRFDTEISGLFGVPKATVYAWLRRDNISKNAVELFCARQGLNPDYFLTGKGEPTKKIINIPKKDIQIEEGDSPVDANYIIELQKDKIEYLQKELAEKNALIRHTPKTKPETLNEISDMLNDASKQWSWVFYKTDKPMSCTRKGILRNVNPALCKLLGYTEDEMLGKSLLEFVHPDDHKVALEEIKKSTRNIQLRVRKSNGKYCKMNIEAQEFGTNGNTFSIGLITCCEKGCPDL
jgi:PAS domain S-box-containing protein